MEVVRLHDAREFRQQADPLLLVDEASNNLILGVTQTVIDHSTNSSFAGWVVVDDGRPTAVAAQTVPHNLILGIPSSVQALELLANEIGDMPGVVGCQPGVDTFVAARPESFRLKMAQGVYQLESVTLPPPADGFSRPARSDEADELADMWMAFEEEAIGQVEDAKGTREGIRLRIETQSPRLGAWVHEVDGRIVSLSGHKGPTPNGIRIGPVYTPPDLRRRGYASQLVATQSQWLLDNGHRYCFLYTDLANPTSNSIYRRIGYRQVAESAHYELSPTT